MSGDGAEEMLKVVLDLKREVEEMRRLLVVMADALFETDYYVEPDIDVAEIRKLVLDNRNMYT